MAAAVRQADDASSRAQQDGSASPSPQPAPAQPSPRPSLQRQEAAWHGPVAGALAGLASRLVVFPADTIKARLQVQGSLAAAGPGPVAVPYAGTLDAVAKVAAGEGLIGFYRGFSAMAIGIIPGNMAYFGGYELGKRVVPEGWGPARPAAIGVVAQVLAGVVFTPIDLIKERLQVQRIMGGATSQQGAAQAIRALLRDAGWPGLLKGYWATNAVWLPWNIIYISAYERSKSLAAHWLADDSSSSALQQQQHLEQAAGSSGGSSEARLPPWAIACCSAGSAAAAAVLTHPADVIKTRLQVLSAGKEGRGLTSLEVAKQLLRREGWRGLSSGMTARVLSIAPGAALSWALYEAIKERLPG